MYNIIHHTLQLSDSYINVIQQTTRQYQFTDLPANLSIQLNIIPIVQVPLHIPHARPKLFCCLVKQCMLPACRQHSVLRIQWRSQPVASAAQGYRLWLSSTTHILPAGAARNQKMQIFWPLPTTTNFLHSKPPLKHPESTLKIWKQPPLPFQSYKQTNSQTDKQAYTHNA